MSKRVASPRNPSRMTAEHVRVLAEEVREVSERSRGERESVREEREALRDVAEQARHAAEDARHAAEEARHATIAMVAATADTLSTNLAQMQFLEDARSTAPTAEAQTSRRAVIRPCVRRWPVSPGRLAAAGHSGGNATLLPRNDLAVGQPS